MLVVCGSLGLLNNLSERSHMGQVRRSSRPGNWSSPPHPSLGKLWFKYCLIGIV